jgi:hypothetical protein
MRSTVRRDELRHITRIRSTPSEVWDERCFARSVNQTERPMEGRVSAFLRLIKSDADGTLPTIVANWAFFTAKDEKT